VRHTHAISIERQLTVVSSNRNSCCCCGSESQGQNQGQGAGTELAKVRLVRLNNRGAFVVRLQFVYVDSQGRKIRTRGTGDIRLGETVTVNPGDFGVPEGATFHVYASVVAGRDKISCESFVYNPSIDLGIEYRTTGTTLFNSLTLDGLFPIFWGGDSGGAGEDVIDDEEFHSLLACNEDQGSGCESRCSCCCCK